MRNLEGKTVALGVTGSIAAVECVKIVHELRRRGAEVYAVMTEAATDIVHEYALEFATGNPVITEITGDVEHVELVGELESDFESFRDTDARADVFLVAPATANTVGKIAAAEIKMLQLLMTSRSAASIISSALSICTDSPYLISPS